jgi:hypothetical protein
VKNSHASLRAEETRQPLRVATTPAGSLLALTRNERPSRQIVGSILEEVQKGKRYHEASDAFPGPSGTKRSSGSRIGRPSLPTVSFGEKSDILSKKPAQDHQLCR